MDDCGTTVPSAGTALAIMLSKKMDVDFLLLLLPIIVVFTPLPLVVVDGLFLLYEY